MSKIRSLIYTSDLYDLQIKIVLFPDQEKFLKQVNSGYACTSYQW